MTSTGAGEVTKPLERWKRVNSTNRTNKHMKRVIQVGSGHGAMILMLKMLDTSEFSSREVPVSWLSAGNLGNTMGKYED